MDKIIFVLGLATVGVLCKPVEDIAIETENKITERNAAALLTSPSSSVQGHSVPKRFINPTFTFGSYGVSGLHKMRMKRSHAEDCEKLELCRLHAKSSRNFFSAFELYFVNKENARLWDHQRHNLADCNRRFSHCLY